ncbi:MAG: M42 family metallopeptidase [Oscillospiraceae bacterium]|jgi:putative aminopeptidase FrvX|nr:M42 family metallopeptidase [Oscillospiraceae bacterium]
MLLDSVKALCALSGPSSYEGPVRDYLKARAEAAGAVCQVDRLGNLICEKKGAISAPHKLMLAAHMDEVGLIVKRITDEGYIKFACLGGIDRRVLIGKPVFLGKNRIPGVIGLKAIHLTTPEERKKVPQLDDLYIDIGASDREEGETLTHIGDFAVFSDSITEFGDHMLKAKAIDDRLGCAVMIELLERELPMDVTFAFTVQEEVGTRGAFGAAFSVTPEIALIIEGTTAADSPTTDVHRRVCYSGRGPVIPYMDGGTVYDPKLFDLLRDLAEEGNIPWQTKEYISGGTDARVIQRTKTGVRVAAVSAAVRYLHSPSSIASVLDFQNIEILALRFIEAVAHGRA